MRFTAALLFASVALAAPGARLAERAGTCNLCLVSSLGTVCKDIASDQPGSVSDSRVGDVDGDSGMNFAQCNTFCYPTESTCEGFQIIGGPNSAYSCSCTR